MLSKFRNTGQTCVCANRIHARDALHDTFVAKLAAEVAKLEVGDGMEAGVTQGPPINEKAVGKGEAHVAGAAGKGATAVTGGKRHVLGGTCFEEFLEMKYLLLAGI